MNKYLEYWAEWFRLYWFDLILAAVSIACLAYLFFNNIGKGPP